MSKKKVMVGMSGGVDSSVAAALLLQKGYDVIGVTLKIWPNTCDAIEKEGGCCSLSAVDDARNVSNKLGIPYYVLNFTDIFKNKVIDYFINEYLTGKTPNPCIACNRYIKFGEMLNKANSMGIDYIATGHYAAIEYDEGFKRHLLKKSMAQKKDQTYALYNLTQFQLSRTLMPLGNYTKEEVRKIAQTLKLKVAAKPDSQEICFVSDNDYGNFINKNTDNTVIPGNFVDKDGKILGRHKGIVYYTIGQRKGLGLAFGKPMFIVKIDKAKNEIVLGDEVEVFSRGLIAGDINLISIDKLDKHMKVKAKIRYSSPFCEATIYPSENNKIKVIFDDPQRAVTPGQSVVFYDEDIVIGGGIIETST